MGSIPAHRIHAQEFHNTLSKDALRHHPEAERILEIWTFRPYYRDMRSYVSHFVTPWTTIANKLVHRIQVQQSETVLLRERHSSHSVTKFDREPATEHV